MTDWLASIGHFADRLVAVPDPVRALRRRQARQLLAYYEAARPGRTRKARRETGSGDTAVSRAGVSIREQARHLEQNHDLSRAVLSILVTRTVGPHGIQVEPTPRRADGSIHKEMASAIKALDKDWARRPEVTWQHRWPSAQRMLARSLYRDGEVFIQELMGMVPGLDHGTRVPYSLEMLECDHVPLSLSQGNITQGVERNAWGRPVFYHVYKTHPGDLTHFPTSQDLKRVPAERMLHAKLIDRIRQARGVSVFAPVMSRFDDIKDIEESFRIADKVAASMAAMIKKGNPDDYDPQNALDDNGDPIPRNLKFRPGMIFDDLLPGESIEMMDTGGRPNVNIDAYLNGQLRRAAGGVGVTGSNLSGDYNGTYSSKRQELVEGWGAYEILASEFTGAIVQPVHQRKVAMAVASGRLTPSGDVDLATLDDALYIAPQMPWIDPGKETDAWKTLRAELFASTPEIIHRRGRNPADVLEEEKAWQKELADAGIPGRSESSSASTDSTNRPPGSRYA